MNNPKSYETETSVELPEDFIIEVGSVSDLTKGNWGWKYEPSAHPWRP
jgi:hypothetical protein